MAINTTSYNVVINKKMILGAGSYGTVYTAQWNYLTCAAKALHPALFVFNIPGKPNMAEQFEKECEVIGKFRHPNIVQFLGMVRDPETEFPVLLTELMDRNLTSLLQESQEPLPYQKQISICHDIVLAIMYLHSEGFIHRDISSNNVLMKGNTAKLSDLGESVLIDSEASNRLTTCPGTEVYMPPDSLGEKPVYTQKIDCFSFGVLCVQILTRSYPKPTSRQTRIEVPLEGIPTQCFITVPEVQRRKEHINLINKEHPLLELILKCLYDEEKKRPSSDEICNFISYLKKIEKYEASLFAETDGRPRVTEITKEQDTTLEDDRVSLEEHESKIAELLSENAQQKEMIVQLETEKTQLQGLVQAQQEPPSRSSLLGGLFGGTNRRLNTEYRQLQEEHQRILTESQELKSRVQKQEKELDEKRKLKANHLEKWDWLEKEYQQKCYAENCARKKLAKVEDDLKEKVELMQLKDERISELERKICALEHAASSAEIERQVDIEKELASDGERKPSSVEYSDTFNPDKYQSEHQAGTLSSLESPDPTKEISRPSGITLRRISDTRIARMSPICEVPSNLFKDDVQNNLKFSSEFTDQQKFTSQHSEPMSAKQKMDLTSKLRMQDQLRFSSTINQQPGAMSQIQEQPTTGKYGLALSQGQELPLNQQPERLSGLNQDLQLDPIRRSLQNQEITICNSSSLQSLQEQRAVINQMLSEGSQTMSFNQQTSSGELIPDQQNLSGMSQGLTPDQQKLLTNQQRLLEMNQRLSGMNQGLTPNQQNLSGMNQGLTPDQQKLLTDRQRLLEVNQRLSGMSQGLTPDQQNLSGMSQGLTPDQQRLLTNQQRLLTNQQRLLEMNQRLSGMSQGLIPDQQRLNQMPSGMSQGLTPDQQNLSGMMTPDQQNLSGMMTPDQQKLLTDQQRLLEMNQRLSGMSQGLIPDQQNLSGMMTPGQQKLLTDQQRLLEMNQRLPGMSQGLTPDQQCLSGMSQGLTPDQQKLLTDQQRLLEMNQRLSGMSQGLIPDQQKLLTDQQRLLEMNQRLSGMSQGLIPDQQNLSGMMTPDQQKLLTDQQRLLEMNQRLPGMSQGLTPDQQKLLTDQQRLLEMNQRLSGMSQGLTPDQQNLSGMSQGLTPDQQKLLTNQQRLLEMNQGLSGMSQGLTPDQQNLSGMSQGLTPDQQKLLTDQQRMLGMNQGLTLDQRKLLPDQQRLSRMDQGLTHDQLVNRALMLNQQLILGMNQGVSQQSQGITHDQQRLSRFDQEIKLSGGSQVTHDQQSLLRSNFQGLMSLDQDPIAINQMGLSELYQPMMSGVNQSMSGINQSMSGVNQPMSGVNQPMPGVNQQGQVNMFPQQNLLGGLTLDEQQRLSRIGQDLTLNMQPALSGFNQELTLNQGLTQDQEKIALYRQRLHQQSNKGQILNQQMLSRLCQGLTHDQQDLNQVEQQKMPELCHSLTPNQRLSELMLAQNQHYQGLTYDQEKIAFHRDQQNRMALQQKLSKNQRFDQHDQSERSQQSSATPFFFLGEEAPNYPMQGIHTAPLQPSPAQLVPQRSIQTSHFVASPASHYPDQYVPSRGPLYCPVPAQYNNNNSELLMGSLRKDMVPVSLNSLETKMPQEGQFGSQVMPSCGESSCFRDGPAHHRRNTEPHYLLTRQMNPRHPKTFHHSVSVGTAMSSMKAQQQFYGQQQQNLSSNQPQYKSTVIADQLKFSERDPLDRAQFCDRDSLVEALKSGDIVNEEYLAVLIQQQYVTDLLQPWKAIFTVCLRNPCCVEPLLDLLKHEYGETFSPSAFVIKFKEEQDRIILDIPENEINQQGYQITTSFTPCIIKRSEMSRPCPNFQGVNYAYPPRFFLQLRPLPREPHVEHCILNVSLYLRGINEERRFVLTSPSLLPNRTLSSSSGSRLQSEEDVLNSQADINEHAACRLIVDQIHGCWEFGLKLGVPMNDLQEIVNPDQNQQCSRSEMTYKILECWNRKTVEPNKKTWNCIINAIRLSGNDSLARDVKHSVLSEADKEQA